MLLYEGKKDSELYRRFSRDAASPSQAVSAQRSHGGAPIRPRQRTTHAGGYGSGQLLLTTAARLASAATTPGSRSKHLGRVAMVQVSTKASSMTRLIVES